MKNWMLLSPQQAIEWFGVPDHLAKNESNVFYGDSLTDDEIHFIMWDTPRHLISLMPANIEKSIITFHFHHIDSELFDLMEGDFNPFDSPFGKYLRLDKASSLELASLLEEYSEQMSSSSEDNDVTLKEVDLEYLKERGFKPLQLNDVPYSYYYFNIQPPLVESHQNEVLISLFTSNRKDALYFEVYDFPSNGIEMSSEHEADEYMTGSFSLNQTALKKISMLLSAHTDRSNEKSY